MGDVPVQHSSSNLASSEVLYGGGGSVDQANYGGYYARVNNILVFPVIEGVP